MESGDIVGHSIRITSKRTRMNECEVNTKKAIHNSNPGHVDYDIKKTTRKSPRNDLTDGKDNDGTTARQSISWE